MWIKIILVTEIFFMVGQVCSDEIYSKACVSSVGPCSHHSMRCNDRSVIGFSSVRFEERSEVCRAGVNNCSSECCQEATGRTRVNLTINQLSNLYRNCSMERTCTYRMLGKVDNIIASFSFLQYVCFHRNDTINVTEEYTEKSGNDITILYRGKDLQQQSGDFEIFNCIVDHGGSNDANISVNALDFSLNANSRSHLTIKTEKSQTFSWSHPLYPYQNLITSNKKQMNIFLQIYPARHRETVWIRLSSSSTFRVKCVNVEQPTSESTTAVVSQNDEPGDNTVIWIIIPSVAGTVAVIIGVAVYCLVCQRRKSQSADHSDIPVSESHPTYCGLTGGDNRVYDHADTPHKDNDYYNVPENSDYQNP